jgi:hypothetical protein
MEGGRARAYLRQGRREARDYAYMESWKMEKKEYLRVKEEGRQDLPYMHMEDDS